MNFYPDVHRAVTTLSDYNEYSWSSWIAIEPVINYIDFTRTSVDKNFLRKILGRTLYHLSNDHHSLGKFSSKPWKTVNIHRIPDKSRRTLFRVRRTDQKRIRVSGRARLRIMVTINYGKRNNEKGGSRHERCVSIAAGRRPWNHGGQRWCLSFYLHACWTAGYF